MISRNYIIKERLINKSSEYLYNKWTTKEGLNSFFSVDNDINIIPLGKYEIYFTKEKLTARGSEGCVVLSFIPNKMLSFTWNTPPSFPELRNSGYYTWVVIEFISQGAKQTLVRLTNLGYPADGSWDRALAYFDKAWDYVMDELVKSCEVE